ncbi:hypothetical protein Tsubulata_035234 [Turnera subulata]|uniref:Cystatin domain-containing protein n=1 Tax=Turnera subulata TaxID=218843 RepID=A0A9Q0FWW2_9ROSI|nr:hypothetical protein Tsubulata_035234 [Turnera subulata]
MATTGSISGCVDLRPPWKRHSEKELKGGCVLDDDWNQFLERFVVRAKGDDCHSVQQILTGCGYYNQIRKSKGFEVPEIPIKNNANYLYPTDPEDKLPRVCARYAAATIGAMKGMKLEVVEVVRANLYVCWNQVFYVTFTVREKGSANQTPQTYQAIVALEEQSRPGRYGITVVYIRLKPQSAI